MTTATSTLAAVLLQSLLDDGALNPRHEEYLDSNFRTNPKSWYFTTKNEEGEAEAEDQLYLWSSSRRMADYASCIEPIVRGMLAIATCDAAGDLVGVSDIAGEPYFPGSSSLRDGKMIVVVNRAAPGCGCVQPKGSSILGSYGRLGVMAVVLRFSSDMPCATELGVVLPARSDQTTENGRCGFTIAAIDLYGHTDGHTVVPNLADSSFMMKMIRMDDGSIPRAMFSSGGHFDDAVGFPGATDYLANNLPQLEPYFIDLAGKLSGEHVH